MLLAMALKAHETNLEVHVAKDGEDAIEKLAEAGSGKRCFPDLIVLDLNLPKLSGIEVLTRIRRDERLQQAPVVVLTSSDSPIDRNMVEAIGVQAYFKKPMMLDDFLELGSKLLQIAATHSAS